MAKVSAPSALILALHHKALDKTPLASGSLDEVGGGNEDGKQAAAEDILQAIEDKDAEALAEAFENMFVILESEPHEEAGEAAESEP